MSNLSPQFTEQQLNDNPLLWKVHRGVANFTPGQADNGLDKSTFEIHDENNKKRIEAGNSSQGIGIHWSFDPKVAKEFALNDHGFDTPKIAGVVYHGHVHSKDVWDYDEPGSVEHHDEHEIYHPYSEEYGSDYGESEVTVKEDKPVYITGTTSYLKQEPFKNPVPFNVSYDHAFKVKA